MSNQSDKQQAHYPWFCKTQPLTQFSIAEPWSSILEGVKYRGLTQESRLERDCQLLTDTVHLYTAEVRNLDGEASLH